jgi:hypothetical protein
MIRVTGSIVLDTDGSDSDLLQSLIEALCDDDGSADVTIDRHYQEGTV